LSFNNGVVKTEPQEQFTRKSRWRQSACLVHM